MTTNFASEPYYDDYNENNKFYRILFRPGYAVQARELTQLQTILQNQIKRHGDNIFKQGSVVVPGHLSINPKVAYVKLESTYSSINVDTYIDSLVGETITGGTSGVTAKVVYAVQTDSSEVGSSPMLYIQYSSSGTDTVTKLFQDGETLSTGTISVSAKLSASTGNGSLAIIKKGVYYINGFFTLVEPQTIILDKYTTSPSYKVGLTVVEKLITPDTENYEMLLDNAQNSYNYAAPGAHRFYIELTLSKLLLTDSTTASFVEVARVDSGVTTFNNVDTQYNVIYDTMARRTYDESGNYIVNDFSVEIKDHRDNNRGEWATGKSYLLGDIVTHLGNRYVARSDLASVTVPPTHTLGITGFWEYNTKPFYNRGKYTPENGGDADKLVLAFDAGKAYVNGYEIAKISTTFVNLPKARTSKFVNNGTVTATVGNYVVIQNVHGMPPFSTFGTINLYDTFIATGGTSAGTLVGTARVRGIEAIDSTTYRLFVADVKMLNTRDFSRTVKSFYYNGGSVALSFTADINPVLTKLDGSISVEIGTGNVTGNGTTFSADLVTQDYIQFQGTDGEVYNKYVTITPTSITSATIEELPATKLATNVPYYLVTTTLLETDRSEMLFPMAQPNIKSSSDISYYVMQKYTPTSTLNQIVLTSGNVAFTFTEVSSNYIVVNNSTGAIVPITTVTTSSGATSATLTVSISAGVSCTVLAVVNKTGLSGTSKIKTLNSGGTDVIITKAGATKSVISLAQCDCFNLVKVLMAPLVAWGTTPTSGQYTMDITENYSFDSGQRDSYYDYGSIVLSQSAPVPTGPIKIVYEYFAHTSGDFCNVTSYTDPTSNVGYDFIPFYNGIRLSDVIDFRPKISDSYVAMPKRGYNFSNDYEYYLGRKDKIALDSNGVFSVISGAPALNPKFSTNISSGMTLYELSIPAYTLSPDSVSVDKIDNKRYTMRDIGKLESRITSLEYYTSLSLLEQNTASLLVTDANGKNKFKNGFFVDNFSTLSAGDVKNVDYSCSIDADFNELRPFCSMENINLVEDLANHESRLAQGYKLYGDLITVKLDDTTPHVAMVKQPYGSRTEFVNPFAVFTFIGDVKINPSSDDWFEVKRLPDVVTNVMGNYDVLYALAKKSGVIGTVWNSWQTTWSGKSTTSPIKKASTKVQNGGGNLSFAAFDQAYGKGEIGNGAVAEGRRDVGVREVTYQDVTTSGVRTRTGIKTSFVEQIDTKVVDDKILSTSIIPYIRSRNILIQVKGLKPTTRFYPTFEGVDITPYCTPASKITLTGAVTGSFDCTTNVGSDADNDAQREIDGDKTVCLNIGDVLYVSHRGSTNYTKTTAPATAIVVGKEFNEVTNVSSLFVVNINGTFSASDTVMGSISGASATFGSIAFGTLGGNIFTNINGSVNLLFNIPQTSSIRFRTGTREFKLADVTSGIPNSVASANYEASGVVQTKQRDVTATRNGTLVSTTVTESKNVTKTDVKVITDSGWHDPLAQTFLVTEEGGAFLSKVDLYFAVKSQHVPVRIQIREVVNGYPGSIILPFSDVTLQPEDVNISTNLVPVTIDGVTISYPKADVATTFTFPSPVYVNENISYCIVIMSDSDAYRVWISNMGDAVPDSNKTIDKQPYMGVLFKSQNASTWTANQEQDLMFTLWRANFATNVNATVTFSNQRLNLDDLDTNPFETFLGSNKVRVHHENHGMCVGSNVAFKNAPTTLNNVTLINSHQYTISDVELDSYVITTTGSNADASLLGGDDGIRASKDMKYDLIQPQMSLLSFGETEINASLKTTTGYAQFKSADGSIVATQTPYVRETEWTPCAINENNYFSSTRTIGSAYNPITLPDGSDNKALKMQLIMSTTNPSISPIIDTHRHSAILVSNKIDNPTEGTVNGLWDVSTLIQASSGHTVSFADNTITTSDTAFKELIDTIQLGSYIKVTNTPASANDGSFLVTAVDGTNGIITTNQTFTTMSGSTVATISTKNHFYDEITPVGSSTYSKYVTRNISLTNPSDHIKVIMSTNVPTDSDILVYYKTANTGANLSKMIWTELPPVSPIVKTSVGNDTFKESTFSVEGIVNYDLLKIKIVFKSTNSSAVPRAKDLQVIASI